MLSKSARWQNLTKLLLPAVEMDALEVTGCYYETLFSAAVNPKYVTDLVAGR